METRMATLLRWITRLSLGAGIVLILAAALYVGWQTWTAYQVKADVLARLNQARQEAQVDSTVAETPSRDVRRKEVRVGSEGIDVLSRDGRFRRAPRVAPELSMAHEVLEVLARTPADIPNRDTPPTREQPALASSPPQVPAVPRPTPTPEPGAPPVWISIPALGIDVPVVPVEPTIVQVGNFRFRTWETADYAAGYHVGTAYPGQAGNVVIAGHNNIKGAVFRPISVLGNPDVPFPEGIAVYVTDARGRVFLYRFAEMYKVREAGASLEERIRNASFIAPTEEPVLTLITCWPVTGNTHRVIVRATLVGEVTAATGEDASLPNPLK